MAERTFRDGARAVGPLAVAVVGFGISFGVLARAVGFGWLAPIVMSATTFAGSAQFASVSVLGGRRDGRRRCRGGTAAEREVRADRHLGRAVPDRFILVSVRARTARGDESWAIAAEGDGRFSRGVLLGAGVVLYVSWVAGTTVGAIVGQGIGDPATFGLDAAFAALFLGLLVPMARDRRHVAAALLGATIALALTPFAPAGVPIIAASAACLLG
jgi:predicted branched-subunit amino acid permease